MNYIKHLNTAFKKIAADDRLTASHVSLYVSLFQCWNLNRFKNPISINRTELMNISCIGSRSTYHRNLKQLAHWNYIDYRPSKNPLLGSKVYLLPFGQNPKNTSPKSGQLVDQSSTGASTESEQLPGQVPNPSLNTPNNSNCKQSKRSSPKNSKKNVPDKKKVVQYFQKKEQPKSEAEKFHNYYTGKGWRINGDQIENWQAVADNWITRSGEFKKTDRENFNVSNQKNFSEPL